MGTTIQVYLPDGNPRSVKIAEITSRTVQAILIPRAKIDYADTRTELSGVAVYFLIGSTDDEHTPKLYVGEAEECMVRLKQQNKAKDFWNVAIAIVSKTHYFTKSHIKFLEWLCHSEAQKIGRYRIDNSTVPTKPYIPEPVEADLADNYETIKVLVATLGYPIFEEIKTPAKKDVLICKGKAAYATGEYTEDGLVIFAGSKCNLEETESAGPYLHNWRQQLIDEGVLQEKDGVLVFTTNHVASSPSTAAAVVLGRRANGWTEWVYQNGKTLDEVHRQGKTSA